MEQCISKFIKKDLIYAIIPARSGSKGIKDKNIKCIKGYPLIAYSIAVAQLVPTIDRIIVSTDSEKYGEVANYYGADVPFYRPKAISSDSSTDIEFVEHAIQWLYSNEKVIPEYFVHLRPTYPFRDKKIIDNAISMIKLNKEATSLRSAYQGQKTPYKWFKKINGHFFEPLFDTITLDEANNPRQEFPKAYIPDGYVDILRSEFIIKNDLLHGDKMIALESPKGIDIDLFEDFKAISLQPQSKSISGLFEYLQKNFKTLEQIEQE